MKNKKIKQGKVIVYKNRVEVRLEAETVWLTQAEIAKLFGIKRPAITKHLSNIFKAKELNKKAVCSKMEHTASDGKRYIAKFYNLDVIISVGYRVNSIQATQFRIWATNVLRKHLVNGYTLNQKRLAKDAAKYKELQKAIELISNVESLADLSTNAKGIIRVISDYRRALDILDDFDHQNLQTPKGTKKSWSHISNFRQKRALS